jgi:hypothetical protein
MNAKPPFRFAVATGALLAAGAALANVTEDIVVGGGAVIPSLGLSVDLAGNSSVQDHTPLSHAIETGFSYAHATHKQTLDGGDGPVNFGGSSFQGPQDIRWTSNIRLAHVGYRPRYWFGRSNFAVQGLIGLGWAGLGLKGVGSADQPAAERMSNGGVVLGGGGLWRFARATSLQVRVVNFYSGSKEGVTSASRFEVTVSHEIGKNVQLRGGVGVLTARSAREDADSGIRKSPVNAAGGGLLLGLDAVF